MTSSPTFRSRSYKIKESTGKDSLLQSKVENDLDPDVESNSSCEPSSTRARWKTFKIFSRTLSSVEVIRAMKNTRQNHQHHNQTIQNIPVSPTKPSVIVTATGDSAISTSIVPALPKNPSVRHEINTRSLIIKDHSDGTVSPTSNESLTGMVRTRSSNSKAASEWKVLKNKLASLRKRSTSGSSSGPSVGSEDALPSTTSPGPGDGENEGSSIRRLSSNSRTGSARTSRSGSQDEGIVCKREDLINLLTEATKVANSNSVAANSPPPPPPPPPPPSSSSSSSSPSTVVMSVSTTPSLSTTTTVKSPISPTGKSDQPSNETSPTLTGPRKVILKTSSACNNVVQITGSDTIDSTRKLTKKSALKKNPSAGSNNSYNSYGSNNNDSRPNSSNGGSFDNNYSLGFTETRIVVPSKPSLKFELPHEKVTRIRPGRGIQFKEVDNSSSPLVIAGSTSTLSASAKVQTSYAPDNQATDINSNELTKSDKKILAESNHKDVESSAPAAAAVKWDESNVVDAMMLGDAIQAFLRGMGASAEKPPEKRVLFKKTP